MAERKIVTTFSIYAQEQRNRHKETREQQAKKLGITPRKLRDIDYGRIKCPVEVLDKFIKVYKLDDRKLRMRFAIFFNQLINRI